MKLNNSIFATEHIQIDAGLPLVPIIRQFFWIRYFCSMYRFYSNVRRISLNIQIFYFFNRQYFNIDKSKTRYCWAWHQKWCKPYLHHMFLNLFWQIFFFLMLMKKCVFVLKNFPPWHKLNKEDDLTSASYLNMLNLCQHLLSQTKWS